jgi:hypothetical protein
MSRGQSSTEYRRVRQGVERVNKKYFNVETKDSMIFLEAKRVANQKYQQARNDVKQKVFSLK